MSNTVIELNNISKLYRLGEVGTGTLSHDLNRWWHRLRGKEDPYAKVGEENNRESKGGEYVWAIQDINFKVNQGDVLGVIGKNGAGKSTLLKILSRVTAPTKGTIKAKGRIASLLEVGTGFHPELTGRENIFLNGAILGMTKTEIRRKFDEIVSFSGVERYIDTPVKRYSSGMYVRLAFAVAAHLESEILIVDEVLAVGDAEFQKKCLGRMKDVSAKEGRTVLFVSHNLTSIKNLCNLSLYMKNGKLSYCGDTSEAISMYMNDGNLYGENRLLSWDTDSMPTAKELDLLSITVLNKEGSNSALLSTEDNLAIEIEYVIKETVSNMRVLMILYTSDGVEVFASSDYHFQNETQLRVPGSYKSICHIPNFFLNGGSYYIEVYFEIPRVKDILGGQSIGFEISEMAYNSLGVTMGKYPGGVIHPKLSWDIINS